jgi:hypothetical protein
MDEKTAHDLAQQLRLELPALLGADDDAAAVDSQLAEFLERGRLGDSVGEEILRLVRRHPTLRQRAAELVAPGPTRSIQPPPGDRRLPAPPRYVCPVDGYEWYHIDGAQPIPTCPNDGTSLVRDLDRGTA